MKNTQFKRLLAGVLAVLMMLTTMVVLSSCGNSDENKDNNAGEQTGTEAGTDSAYGSLTAEKFNREFAILNRGEQGNKEDFVAENAGSDRGLLESMIYERNVVVSENYGITLKIVTENDYDAVINKVKSQSDGGFDEFDIAIGHKNAFVSCAQANYVMDLAAIDELQLDERWWDAACRQNLTVAGKTYLMTGDILPSSMMISSCMTFNKALMSDLKMTEPYQLVRDGDWTLDVFNEMTAGVTRDLNGDQKIEWSKDQYGVTGWAFDAPFSLFYGAGGMFVKFDEDGVPTLEYTAKNIEDIYAKLYKAVIEQKAYYVTDIADYENNYKVFTEGRALFCDITLKKITQYVAGMDQDYGILPMPKYDTYQQEYLSFVNGASSFIMIINTEKAPDFVAAIVDAMGAYNYDNVTPKMFEIITKLQAARDPQSAEMVDYIVRNRVYDFGYFFNLGITNVIQDGLKGKSTTVSKSLRSTESKSKSDLGKIVGAFEQNS